MVTGTKGVPPTSSNAMMIENNYDCGDAQPVVNPEEQEMRRAQQNDETFAQDRLMAHGNSPYSSNVQTSQAESGRMEVDESASHEVSSGEFAMRASATSTDHPYESQSQSQSEGGVRGSIHVDTSDMIVDEEDSAYN